ncbi:3-keto-5-aminohexanoate cleavage protein [Streptomyces sp. NPDC093089]|uniref:3-keto-5-aminohexanoate cleavage protein n=1 Tax=Streptomyces sp. NPDC093089 TaxID=3366024 RepID=UPI003821F69A
MTRTPSTVLQVCLNGSREPGDSAAVPTSPESLAASAAAAVAAGAGEVRVHPRTPCGRPSLSPRVLTPVLTSLRAALGPTGAPTGDPSGTAPGPPVPVTTALSAEPDTERRAERVRSWTALPDLVSVDWHEPGAERIAAALLDRGIGVEAALWPDTDGPARFARSPLAHRVVRILAAARNLAADSGPATGSGAAGTGTEAVTLALALLTEVGDRRPPGVPVLLHGVEGGAWPVLRLARRLGLVARIGLEDTLFLPDGARARSNAELVAAAVRY